MKAALLAWLLAFQALPAVAVEPVSVDLNMASEQQLEQLPGIGPKKAGAIVELRKKRPFSRLTQLMEIRGIGKKTLERLKPYLRVDGAPAPAPPAPAVPAVLQR